MYEIILNLVVNQGMQIKTITNHFISPATGQNVEFLDEKIECMHVSSDWQFSSQRLWGLLYMYVKPRTKMISRVVPDSKSQKPRCIQQQEKDELLWE